MSSTTTSTPNPSSLNQSQAATNTSQPIIPAQEPKLNYAQVSSSSSDSGLTFLQAAGKANTSSGSSTPNNPTTPTTSVPPAQTSVKPPQTSTPQPPPNVAMNPLFPNGTAGKPVMPPTGPAALNGSMTPHNHSRASSTTSNYSRSAPPTGPHSQKPSISAPAPYAYPAQSPRIPVNNGRNSPFPEYDERSPPQPRNGSVTMARHGSSQSQSGQVPPSPRATARQLPQYAPQYPYNNSPQFNPGYSQAMPGRGGFRNPSGTAAFQPGMQQQFQRQPPRSPHQQNIQMAPQVYGMPQGVHMPMQPMPAPGQYVLPFNPHLMQ